MRFNINIILSGTPLQMMAVSNDLLEAVARHPGLKQLKIGGPTLASFPPGFLLSVLKPIKLKLLNVMQYIL